MPEGLLPSVFGFVRDIKDRQRTAKVDDQLKNYLTDPEGTVKGITEIDPRFGIRLEQDRVAQQQSAEESRRKRMKENTGFISQYMRGLDPKTTDIGAAIDELAPFFSETLGTSPEEMARFRAAVTAHPDILQGLDDEAFKAMAEDRFSEKIATPGSYVRRGGETVEKVPYGMQVQDTAAGALSRIFDPNVGRYVDEQPGAAAPSAAPSSGGPSQLTVEALLPHIVAQESGGDYTARNAETGALGAYQVMPETGRALARQVGVAWRPDMMQKDDPASRKYQDAIGGAAIQEAVNASGGDPSAAFAYYYGGPDKSRHGPRTRQYVEDMTRRIGGDASQVFGQQAVMTPTSTYNPPRPSAAPVTSRSLTPQEVAERGYRPGTVVQVDSTGKEQVRQAPAATSKTASLVAGEERAKLLSDMTTRYLTAVERLRDHPGLETAVGVVQGRLPGLVLGQDAQDAINLLENLGDQTALTNMLAFKSSSATGATGFGNMSNAEGTRLENAFGSLKRTNSIEQLRDTLDSIYTDISAISKRQAEGFAKLEAEKASGGGEVPVGATATNPQTGEKIRWNGTEWEPM